MVYFNIVRAKTIVNSPYNERQDAFADRVIRGNIVDKNGNVLAETNVAEDGTEVRNYPYGAAFAHVVGYSFCLLYTSDIELKDKEMYDLKHELISVQILSLIHIWRTRCSCLAS